MKNLSFTVLLSCCIAWASAQQRQGLYSRQINIGSQTIEAAYKKTTSLVFPAAISSVDRGSEDIIVQKAAGVENVLRVKAGTAGFKETNLSVITADGQFYSFRVDYNESPAVTAVMIGPAINNNKVFRKAAVVRFNTNGSNETQLRKLAAQASITKRNIQNVRNEGYGIQFALTGLYTHGDWFFYKFMVTNSSLVSYDIESLRLYIKDRKKIKRTATQQIELQPLLMVGVSEPIGGKSSKMMIVALPKQTIASDKQLTAVLQEHAGGRNLRCTIRSNILLRAKPISITPAVDNIPNVLPAGK